MAEPTRKRTKGKNHFNTKRKVAARRALASGVKSNHGAKKAATEARRQKDADKVLYVMGAVQRQERSERRNAERS